jgi:hypothetical protein
MTATGAASGLFSWTAARSQQQCFLGRGGLGSDGWSSGAGTVWQQQQVIGGSGAFPPGSASCARAMIGVQHQPGGSARTSAPQKARRRGK